MESLNVHELFYYDETSPSCLRSKIDRFKGTNHSVKQIAVGDVVGHQDKDGYWIITVRRKRYKAHRIIWELHNGSFSSELDVDHIDGDPSNNVIVNLRAITRQTNQQNMRKTSRNTSGVVGVNYQEQMSSSGAVYGQWLAGWHEDGKFKRKSFGCNMYGDEEAFRLACEYRKRKIEELNAKGANYTERHGL